MQCYIRGKPGLMPLTVNVLSFKLLCLIYKWSQQKAYWIAAVFSQSFSRGNEWTGSKILFCSCNKKGFCLEACSSVQKHDILSANFHLFLLVGYSSHNITELTYQQFLTTQGSVQHFNICWNQQLIVILIMKMKILRNFNPY